MHRLLLLVVLTLLPSASWAQLSYDFDSINKNVPDGPATGLVDTHEISDAPGQLIADLNVTLSISGTGADGGFNGDLYVTLQHGGGFSVLLNRPGARSGATYGYGDSGLSITLDDQAPQDVHTYRQVLTGSDTIPLGGSLTGTWQPDARTADPTAVLTSSTRSATLASFIGEQVNGTWTLFVADVSSGAPHRLDSWTLEFVVVPEPKGWAILFGSGLLLFALAKRARSNRAQRRSA